MRASPDGHTLLMVTGSNAVNATLYKNLNYNFIRDIAPVIRVTRGPLLMAVNSSFPAKTVLSSSAMPRPIRARSTWRRLEVEVPRIWSVSCSANDEH